MNVRTTFGKRKTPPAPDTAPPSPKPEPRGDQRVFRRTRAFKGAVILYDGGLMSCPCRVTEMSGAGARLQFDHDLALPHRFTLVIGLDGIAVDCALSWYDARRMGVRFLSPLRQVSPRQVQSLQPSDAPRGPRMNAASLLPEVRSLIAAPDAPDAPARGLVADLPKAESNVVRFPGGAPAR